MSGCLVVGGDRGQYGGCGCKCRLRCFRRELPADVSGDAGGAGLVPGPAGDHPDPQISVGHGEQQGRTLRLRI